MSEDTGRRSVPSQVMWGARTQIDTRGPEMELREFLSAYEAKVIPLTREKNLAYINASISGKDSDYEKSAAAQIALDKIHSDTAAFAEVKAMRESGRVTDPILKRQLDIVYLSYLGKQIDENTLQELIKRQTAVEQRFNTYRATVDGQELSNNQIDSILRSSTDTVEREKAWKASKRVGREIAADIIELVKLRNRAAQSVGFANFYEMQLGLGEQEPSEVVLLFDQLDTLTRGAFESATGGIDSALSARYKLNRGKLQPWYYEDRFFQEAPGIYDVDLDLFYRDKDPVEIARKYFAGIGLPVDDILKRSDLYERPGKTQSAECANIDRSGDVRIVCNMQANHFWTEILLHELGHGVYDYFNDRQESWLLRDVAHPLTTEAVAAFFGRLAGNSRWLTQMAGVPEADANRAAGDCARMNRLVQLLFSRFVQVMVRFERGLYENPDQDLNGLWWDLVEKYQGMSRPEGRDEPDWASKSHITSDPVYYHNYLIAELLASQFTDTIGRDVLGSSDPYRLSFAGDPRVGEYFRESVFHPGCLYPWNEMIERATGEKLSSVYYARQFIETE